RAHEPLVSRHVDDAEGASGRQLQPRESELDRDPALALLRKPVSVDAGQGAHQHRLTVIDVARGTAYERRRHQPRRDSATAFTTKSISTSEMVRGSSSTASSRILATIGGSP